MSLSATAPVSAPPNGVEKVTRPRIAREGMGYVWDVADHNAVIRVDYLTARSNQFSGDFEVTLGGKHLHQGNHGLSSTTSRTQLANALGSRARSVPWDELVETFCAAVVRAERQGEPLAYVGTNPRAPVRYVVDDLLQEGKPNLLFGPGGGGKGLLAVRLCVGMTMGYGLGRLTAKKATPIYFDWEDDAATMNNRIQLVCEGLEIDPIALAYKRMKGALADRVNEAARAVAQAKATVGVIDSVSVAAGTVGRGETWDSIAHRLFDALDLIPSGVPGVPMTWLLIGHVTGDSATRPGDVAGKMIGSIQNMNRARVAWEIRSDQDDGSSEVHATLYHAKWNHTGRRKPIGLTYTFTENAVTIEEGASTTRPGRTKLADQAADYFAEHGKASVRALALALRANEASLRTILNREPDRFISDAEGFWNLARVIDPSEEVPW